MNVNAVLCPCGTVDKWPHVRATTHADLTIFASFALITESIGAYEKYRRIALPENAVDLTLQCLLLFVDGQPTHHHHHSPLATQPGRQVERRSCVHRVLTSITAVHSVSLAPSDFCAVQR
jgi:hypothetical protein